MDTIPQHEVIIIGNGPSSIVLSFLLSGHWPYYNPNNPHPLDYLHQRLQSLDGRSLLEVDLAELCQGLTGRSSNPVSVLFDHLQHPQTDFGSQQPSTLNWVLQPTEKSIDHLVLGAGPPGGVWGKLSKHKRVQEILTVSRRRWMQLPELELAPEDGDNSSSNQRATFKEVADYYTRFIEHFKLTQNFLHHTKVVHVHWDQTLESYVVEALQKVPIISAGADSSRLGCFLRSVGRKTCGSSYLKTLRFRCRKLVLATGNSTLPVMLNVPGEDHRRFVFHSLEQLDSVLRSGCVPLNDTVLVVGSGLSAADAITMLMKAKNKNKNRPIRVVHIFRRAINDRSLIFRQLSNTSLYPEYQQVFDQMKSTTKQPLCLDCFLTSDKLYQAYSCCGLASISTNRVVNFSLKDTSNDAQDEQNCVQCEQPLWSKCKQLKVSLVQILVGRRPQLNFLAPEVLASLGRRGPGVDIDSRHNPIAIEPYSHRLAKNDNIYAIGPLVGDNFVRFVQGGALAVANHIVRQQQPKQSKDKHHVGSD